jgi:hypothetical protein
MVGLAAETLELAFSAIVSLSKHCHQVRTPLLEEELH